MWDVLAALVSGLCLIGVAWVGVSNTRQHNTNVGKAVTHYDAVTKKLEHVATKVEHVDTKVDRIDGKVDRIDEKVDRNRAILDEHLGQPDPKPARRPRKSA